MDGFTDKVALITGAGRGIGREIALAFSSLGTAVAANDLNPLNVDETVAQIRQTGGHARDYVFDLAKRMPVEAMVAQVVEHFGRIDFLVNQGSVDPVAPIMNLDEWDFHRTLDVNLGGPFFCIQHVARVMHQLGGGAIVNIVSTHGLNRTNRGHAAHTVSQAGLIGLTHAAANELAEFDIRVNAICLSSCGLELAAPNLLDSAVLQNWRDSYPGLLLGEHFDLVSLVIFLCSDAAAAMTGQVLSLEPNS